MILWHHQISPEPSATVAASNLTADSDQSSPASGGVPTMNESALKMRLGAVARVRVSNEDLAGTIDLTNRLRALQDENAVLRRQAGDLTRHNESLRETCSKKHR
jgi:hypothetical protein